MAIETKPLEETQVDNTKVVYEENKLKLVDKTTNQEIVQNQTTEENQSNLLALKTKVAYEHSTKENSKQQVTPIEKATEDKESKQEGKPLVT